MNPSIGFPFLELVELLVGFFYRLFVDILPWLTFTYMFILDIPWHLSNILNYNILNQASKQNKFVTMTMMMMMTRSGRRKPSDSRQIANSQSAEGVATSPPNSNIFHSMLCCSFVFLSLLLQFREVVLAAMTCKDNARYI